MLRPVFRSTVAYLALVAAASLPPTGVRGDDAAEPEVELAVPFVILNVASVDTVLTDIQWMFNSVQRSDMNEVVGGYLAQAKDLKGVDRKKPFGQVVFLDTASLPPRPAFVAYVPVENLAEALKTLMAAPVTVRKVVGRDDQYDVLASEGDTENIVSVIRTIGGYAYIAPKEFVDIFDRLPDMEKIARGLASRYDAALTVQIKAIPQGVRQVFINFLRTQAEIDLQRRDEEDEAAYLVRRSQGMNALETIEQIALQGEDFTLGWNSEPEQHLGYFEATLNATPESEFAKYLTEVAAKPSMFTPLREEDRPLTINLSWVMNKREQLASTGLLDAIKVAIAKELPELAQPGGAIEQMYDSLKATVDAGHIDMYFQFIAADVQEFVFQGGMKLAERRPSARLDLLLQGLIVKIQSLASTDPGAVEDAPTIIPNAENHQGVSFHKLIPKDIGDDEQRMYGGVPDIYLGTSSRVFWFAVGGTDALPELKKSIDTLLTTPPAERAEGGNVPFSVTVRVAPWLELPLPKAPENVDQPGLSEEEQQRMSLANTPRRGRGRQPRQWPTKPSARPTVSGLRAGPASPASARG